MNVLQSLRSLSAYPIPSVTLTDIAEGAGLATDTEITTVIRSGAAYKRACARVYMFLADAPNVSQGGQSYSFSEDERRRFASRANGILEDIGDVSESVECGYIGEDL